jgi:hypothetical protein
MNDKKVLDHKGSVSKIEMEKHVDGIYEKFVDRRKTNEALLADSQDLEELKQIEEKIKKK